MFNVLCYFLLGMIWGSSFPLMKIITPYIGAPWVIEARSIFGAVFLSLVLIPKFPKIHITNNLTKLIIISLCKLVLPFFLVAKASETIPASIIAVLFSTGPMWSAVLTIILGNQTTSKVKILGLILGFSGVLILLLGVTSNSTYNNIDVYSLSLPFLAALIYAVGGVYTHHVSKSIRMSPTGMLLASLWIASIVGLLFPLILSKKIPSFVEFKPVLPYMTALGCICTGFANLLYFRLLKAWGAVSAMSVVFMVPVSSMFWSNLLLGEIITPFMLMCSVLIITGSLLVIKKPNI